MSDIIQSIKPVNVGNSTFIAANENIFNGNPATDVINLRDWRGVMFIIQKGAGATGTATITIESCDDTTPTTTTAIAFKYMSNTSSDTWGSWTDATTAGFTTTAGADQMYAIYVDAADLSGTDQYVRLKATEVVSSAVDGSILAILIEPRFAQDQLGRTVLT